MVSSHFGGKICKLLQTDPHTSSACLFQPHCQRFESLGTAATLQGAASDMCQSDLFTLVNCLKALPLDAVHPSWQQETMIRWSLFVLLEKTHSSEGEQCTAQLANYACLWIQAMDICPITTGMHVRDMGGLLEWLCNSVMLNKAKEMMINDPSFLIFHCYVIPPFF